MSQVPLRTWVGFLAMVVGMFMAILDIQIVASSLSEIRAGLSATTDEIGWVQTSYLIAEVVMIPLSGWLARVFSTRWLFVASCGTFTLASAACAFAWDIPSMIVFRALQGLLGGAMIPTVFSTSFRIFPRSMMAGVTVVIGLVATMAPTLGPTLGGWITQAFSWHWLFLINVVPGLLVTVMVAVFSHFDEPDLKLLKTIDLPGILLVALFLGSLQYVLEEGTRKDWLESDLIVAFAIVSATAAVAFVYRSLTIDHPIVDLRAFADRNFTIGCTYSFVLGVGLYGSVYLIPLFLGVVRGYNSLDIGIVLMVVGTAQFLSAPLAGALSKHMDLRLMLGIGLALFGTGLWTNSQLTAEWGFDEMFWPQVIRGISLMLCFLPINTLALGTLPHDRLHNASGLYNLMRNLGGAVGLATINTVLERRFDLHLLHMQEKVTGASIAAQEWLHGLGRMLEPSLGPRPDAAALKLMDGLVRREALTIAYEDVLVLMAALFAFALLLMPLVRKVDPKAAAAVDAEAH